MPSSVRTRPAARQDILDAALYFSAKGNSEIGERFIDALAQAYSVLVEQPDIGAPVSIVKSKQLAGIRKWAVPGFGKHLIFYYPRPGYVEIVRVLHGARDVGRILADEE
ncbi:MAG: type II toxin-antitoxin system RelE/ParE family toxin [Planctomycetota bacterium]